MEDHRKLAKGVFVNTVGMLTKTSRIIYLAIFSRMLGQDGFGLYMLAFAMSELMSKFSVLGLEGGMLKLSGHYVAQDKKDELRWVLSRVLGLGLVLSLIATVLCWSISPWLAGSIIRKQELARPLQLFCLSIPGLCLTSIVMFSIRSTLDMKYENIIRSFFEPMLILSAGVFFLKMNLGVRGLAFAHILSSGLAFIVSTVFFVRLFPKSKRPPRVNWRDLFHTSIPMGGLSMLGLFKTKMDLFFIGRFLPLSSVGIYSAIIEINQILSKMKSLFDPVLVPMAQLFHERIDREKFSHNISVGLRWVMIPILGVLGTMILLPESYLGFFGEHFEEGVMAMWIYSFGQAFASIFGILENVLAITGYAYSVFSQLLVMILSNTALLLIVVPKFGLEGAACASSVFFITISFWRIGFMKRKFQVNIFQRRLLKPLIAFAAPLALFLVFARTYHEQPLFVRVLIGVSYLTVYLVTLIKLGLEDVDRDILRGLGGRMGYFRKFFA